MSKQVNHVNIEPEILHGNWSSYCKYKDRLLILLLFVIFLLMQAIPIQCRNWLKK